MTSPANAEPRPHLALRHGASPPARLARGSNRLLRSAAWGNSGRQPQPGVVGGRCNRYKP